MITLHKYLYTFIYSICFLQLFLPLFSIFQLEYIFILFNLLFYNYIIHYIYMNYTETPNYNKKRNHFQYNRTDPIF
jgi:hypothetical protein